MNANQQVVYPTQSVGPQQLRRLRSMHASLARDFGTALSALLRSPVAVSLTGVEQLTYGQFVFNLETPACFHLLKADPLGERLMLDIEPSILYPMIDRLLGGGREEDPPPNRPLTDIELCLAARIVRLFLQECCHAWQDVVDLKLDVLQVENNPRLLRILPADEMVILSGFEVAIGELRGLARFCVPCRAIERIGDKLVLNDFARNDRYMSDSMADVRVTLAETQITAGELAELRVGDIIATETAVNSPALVSIDGECRFHAKPGAYQGRKAVCLADSIETAGQSAPEIRPSE